jgi:N-acylneuraminate cytidylyltransferase
MNIVGFVFARGGSKGVPGKNLRTVGGKSLVRRAVEVGLQSRHIDRVFISTDDLDIAREARASGAEIPFMRPRSLATDQAAEHHAWQHAIRTFRQTVTLPSIDVLVSLPPTVPLRVSEDIDRCVDTFMTGHADVVVTVSETDCNPFFNAVSVDNDDVVQRIVEPPRGCVRRQDVPAVFQIVPSAYVCRADFVLSCEHYMQGRVRAVVIPRERAVDVDTELDLQWAEFLYDRQAHIPLFNCRSA